MAVDTEVTATPKTTASIIQGLLTEIEGYKKKVDEPDGSHPKGCPAERLRAILQHY